MPACAAEAGAPEPADHAQRYCYTVSNCEVHTNRPRSRRARPASLAIFGQCSVLPRRPTALAHIPCRYQEPAPEAAGSDADEPEDDDEAFARRLQAEEQAQLYQRMLEMAGYGERSDSCWEPAYAPAALRGASADSRGAGSKRCRHCLGVPARLRSCHDLLPPSCARACGCCRRRRPGAGHRRGGGP